MYMALFGFGLGNVMQPITLAVQNAMPPQDIGVATSSATFFRQMGGTAGVALFLSVLFSTVGDNIRDAFQSAARTPAFQQTVADPAVAADPANRPVLDMLQGGGKVTGSALDDTSFIQRLNPVLARPFKVGFSDSMDMVFLLGGAILVLALLLLLFLPQLPLRTQSAMVARAQASPLGERPGIDPIGPAGAHPELTDVSGARSEQPPEWPVRQPVTGAGIPVDGHPGPHPNGAGPPPLAKPVLSHDAASPTPVSNSPVLTGRVEGPDGRPLQAILTVTDFQAQQVTRGTTDADGAYRLILPTGGTYLFICAAEQHQPAACTVTVAAGEVRRDVTLVGASAIEGRVLGHGGEAVPGATVTLTDVRGEVVGVAVAGPDGRYAIADLCPAEYTLTVTAAGALPNARAVAVTGVGPTTVDMVLAANGAVAGTIRAASSGLPVPEASVTLVDATGSVVASATTGADGRYDFSDLPPGSYVLTASGYPPVAARVDLGSDRTDRDVELGTPATRPGAPKVVPGGSHHAPTAG
jgi:hypothetical protein